MKKFIKLIKEKWLRETSLTIILVALILAIFIMINTILKNANINPIDFTKENIYSLSDESKEQIKKIEQNVSIYFFGYEDSSTAVVLGKQYSNVNDKIDVQIISATERPDLASEYGISSTDQLVAVASSQRYKVIDPSEMYTYDTTTYKQIDVTEQKLTNAILDVTIVSKPKIYFLTGHGEYGISSSGEMYSLAQYIVNEVNDVNSIDLLTSDMPQTCDTLIIANPQKDFTDVETEKIQTYIDNGGKIMWMQDPYINIKNYDEANFQNMNKILAEFGISFSKGIVCESSEDNMIGNYQSLIVPNMSYNSIVKDIYTDGKIVMADAGRINNVSDEVFEELNVTPSVFIKSSDKSYYKENFDVMLSGLDKTTQDEEGSFILAETLTKKINEEKSATLIAFSNAFFATNYRIQISSDGYTVPIELRNNKDLLLNTVAFLTNREDSIRIRKDTGVVNFQTATKKQDNIVRAVIFTVPVAIIVSGIVVTVVRKRKK